MDKTNTMIAKHNLPHRAAGFSLVELMVGVIIAIIGSIVIFQVFAVSENYKRTSVAGSDAQQGGVIALYSIEREL
ncbi:MAG: prepilin-type N-terminal cleavage/methylation domain-containing protein, partial [Nitrosomonadaceae bacterium]|nr:prepilin-type N-terminal cleavage/methylation domain-containing protein [Nitrosomonadaceae bacterium]